MAQYGQRSLGQPQTLTLDHVSPATRLLEKRRQMFEVQEALEAQKEEFARREDAFRRREEALRKKDLELQESLIKFNKFLQENESKRTRAVKRATDEKKQRIQKDQDLQDLEKALKEKHHEEEGLKAELARHKKYADFLGEVVEALSEEYPEIGDLLNRHNTLRNANEDLNKTQAKNVEENEQKALDFVNLKKETENDVLNLNNKIAELQLILETEQEECLKKQGLYGQKMASSSEVTLELGQILSSVENLLGRCEDGKTKSKHSRKNEGKKAEKGASNVLDLEWAGKKAMSELEDISMYMLDYKDICDEFQEEEEKKQKRSGVGLFASQAASEAKI